MNTLTVRPAADLDQLVSAVRSAVTRDADWRGTASYVADALREHLPSPDLLSADQLAGERGTSAGHSLHVEPDGSFSMVAIVWQPGALTRVHDHVTWCVFGVLQGVEHEELYVHEGDHLLSVGVNDNLEGDVSGFAPPGDIHRVRNPGDRTAISVHVYGTDISRIDSSVRRVYDLPVRG
jgi:3-mercaptopropionate dioxygenase